MGSIQENLYSLAFNEHEALIEYQKKGMQRKGFSYTMKDELANKERIKKFNQSLDQIKRQLKSLANKYSEFVKMYLSLLSSSPDMNLQLLSVRLNFNDFYKIT